MVTFRPLQPNEIEVKVKQTKREGLIALLYKTARTDMDLLDETVGAEKWNCDYKEIKGNLYCGISIDTGNEWVTKWDCGIESREDEEGNEKKGEASDAFKRAGFKWGIGRELYTSPFIWITPDKCNIKETNGRVKCNDKFVVEEICYSADGKRITYLSIINMSNGGARAYVWGKKPKKADTNASKDVTPREKLIYCLKQRGIDLVQYSKEKGLDKDTPPERYVQLLIELNESERK